MCTSRTCKSLYWDPQVNFAVFSADKYLMLCYPDSLNVFKLTVKMVSWFTEWFFSSSFCHSPAMIIYYYQPGSQICVCSRDHYANRLILVLFTIVTLGGLALDKIQMLFGNFDKCVEYVCVSECVLAVNPYLSMTSFGFPWYLPTGGNE